MGHVEKNILLGYISRTELIYATKLAAAEPRKLPPSTEILFSHQPNADTQTTLDLRPWMDQTTVMLNGKSSLQLKLCTGAGSGSKKDYHKQHLCFGANYTVPLDLFRRHQAPRNVCEGSQNAPWATQKKYYIWSPKHDFCPIHQRSATPSKTRWGRLFCLNPCRGQEPFRP